MKSDNNIEFKDIDIANIKSAGSDLDFTVTEGLFEITINGKNITEGICEDRIIQFATKLLNKVPEIIEGREDMEPTAIYHGDGPWVFYFKPEDANISCSIYNQIEGIFECGNEIISKGEFCKLLNGAVKGLDTCLDECIKFNKDIKGFKTYKHFKEQKNGAIGYMIEQNLLPKSNEQKKHKLGKDSLEQFSL